MATNIEDKIGAAVVHTPDHAVVDICLVHGLGGGRKSTWTKDDIFWPQKLLQNDIPNARIITFGYDADIAHFLNPISMNSVKDHASKLSLGLQGVRSDAEIAKRPIIFLAHSLGGIVCAQSLVQASINKTDNDRDVSDHTEGITFLGTPFDGSDTAKWTNFLRKLSQLSHVGKFNEQLLNHLQKDSHELKSVNKDFLTWLNGRQGSSDQKVRVMCFFEELETSGLGVIVSRDSAMLAGHDSYSLHKDHSNMCKYDGPDDPNYDTVRKVLQRWVREIEDASRAKKAEKEPTNSVTTTFSGKNIGGSQVGQANSGGGSVHNNNTFMDSVFGEL